MNITIGPSTGWLSAKVSPILEFHSAALASAGATAVEIVEGNEARLQAFEQGTLPNFLRYRSMHLGDYRETALDILEQKITRVDEIIERLGLNSTSLHPDLASPAALAKFLDRAIPYGIENMDRDKTFGKKVADLLSLQSDAPFVVDLQHAYENIVDDHGTFNHLVRDLCTSGRPVQHLHLSGEHNSDRGLNHMPLHLATNGTEILALLRELVDYLQVLPPIILEGDYLYDRRYPTDRISDSERDSLIDLAARRMRDEIDWVKERVLNW